MSHSALEQLRTAFVALLQPRVPVVHQRRQQIHLMSPQQLARLRPAGSLPCLGQWGRRASGASHCRARAGATAQLLH